MSLPSMRIRPDVASIILLIMRRDVVFPQPDGPTKTVICPSSTRRSSERTAVVPSSYCLVTAWNSITRDPSGRHGHSPAAEAKSTICVVPRVFVWSRSHGCTTLAGNTDKGSTFHHVITDFHPYPRSNRAESDTQGHRMFGLHDGGRESAGTVMIQRASHQRRVSSRLGEALRRRVDGQETLAGINEVEQGLLLRRRGTVA